MEVGFVTGVPPVVGRKRAGVCSVRVVSPVAPRRSRTVVCALEPQELGKSVHLNETKVAAPQRRRKRDIVAALVAALVLAPAAAMAARSGGRMGGSSFRSGGGGGFNRPSQSFSRSMGTPRTDSHHHHHHHHHGGGMGLGMFSLLNPYRSVYVAPVLTPFWTVGATVGLGMMLFFATAMAFYVRGGFQGDSDGDQYGYAGTGKVTTSVLKVGLLASARELQLDLQKMGRSIDTSSSRGLATILQETSLSLLRHPTYWTHGALSASEGSMKQAENQFVQASVGERSKLMEESFTNVDNRRFESSKLSSGFNEAPGEHIVVTIIISADSDVMKGLPKGGLGNSAQLRQALLSMASVSPQTLYGVEVIWSPHSPTETLTKDELYLDHPEIRSL